MIKSHQSFGLCSSSSEFMLEVLMYGCVVVVVVGVSWFKV